MELLSTFIVWLSPAVCSPDITTYPEFNWNWTAEKILYHAGHMSNKRIWLLLTQEKIRYTRRNTMQPCNVSNTLHAYATSRQLCENCTILRLTSPTVGKALRRDVAATQRQTINVSGIIVILCITQKDLQTRSLTNYLDSWDRTHCRKEQTYVQQRQETLCWLTLQKPVTLHTELLN